jgi:hypothetical protein
VTAAVDNALEPVPWHPTAFEPLRKQGRARVLSPMVIQRSRFLAADPDKAPVPSEGLYYCVRFPNAWYLFAYRFDEFRRVAHRTLWQKHVTPVMACLWAEKTGTDTDQLEKDLYTRPHAFPRGRVESMSRGAYRILHGEDLPASISKNIINRAFGLSANTTWENDLHETCLVADRDYARKRLEITETWPAADQPYGYVRCRRLKPD